MHMLNFINFGLFVVRSFSTTCSKLRNTLESLRNVVPEFNIPTKDYLMQLALTAVRAVNSVRHLSLIQVFCILL